MLLVEGHLRSPEDLKNLSDAQVDELFASLARANGRAPALTDPSHATEDFFVGAPRHRAKANSPEAARVDTKHRKPESFGRVALGEVGSVLNKAFIKPLGKVAAVAARVVGMHPQQRAARKAARTTDTPATQERPPSTFHLTMEDHAFLSSLGYVAPGDVPPARFEMPQPAEAMAPFDVLEQILTPQERVFVGMAYVAMERPLTPPKAQTNPLLFDDRAAGAFTDTQLRLINAGLTAVSYGPLAGGEPVDANK